METSFFARLLNPITSAFAGPRSRRATRDTATTSLESRNLLAAIVSGNLIIQGTSRSDTVIVDDMVVNGRDVVRVVQNGFTQYFDDWRITGEIRFFGYQGNDLFDYAGIIDCYVEAGSGNDRILCGDGWDYVLGGDGHDTIEGWDGSDILRGGAGNDLIDGGFGDDDLYGDSGHDLLGGGAGNDYMNGGSGNDAAFGGSGLDDFVQIGRDPWVYLYPASWTRFGWQTRSAGVQDFNPSQDLILS